MRLYLSSYRLGPRPDLFAALSGSNNCVALILNAGDAWDDQAHDYRVIEQTRGFANIGMDATDVDLRSYVGREASLELRLRMFGSVWVAGGNTLVLRRVMHDSGFDQVIRRMLKEDAIAYGGYSAGICVLAHSLRGLDLVDDPAEVEQAFHKEVLWEGLGILPYTPVPHFQSEHLESEMVDKVVSYLKSEGVAYKTLRDGEAILVDGEFEALLGPMDNSARV